MSYRKVSFYGELIDSPPISPPSLNNSFAIVTNNIW